MTATTRTADTVSPPTPVLSVSPVVLSTPDRAVDLQLRVSAPVTGDELPIILLSHGQGHSNHLSSLNGYAPLADFWAAHGFVVIQPTHLSSTTLSETLDPDTPGAPMHWRSRAQDMRRILDQLDAVETAVPQLLGCLDRSRVAVAGHSMGGHTASLLLGARLTDPHDGTEVDLADPRITAGVLLAAPGRGGDALTEFVAENFAFLLSTDFSQMTTPTLVVAGDKDASDHLTVSGPDWHTDPYVLSPGPKSLLTLFDAEHGLGGVSGYDVAETTDENPERVSAVQRLTWAYLRSALYPGDRAWQDAREALTTGPDPLGRVESKEAESTVSPTGADSSQ
ncbi:chlorophyllase [Streptomyces sp. NPDC051907]|uniref:alpha/beta hydrolase family protein n=1 Tax=Streptomyces sp. NPDC051907 TaxID=3155284 RepID=UPI003428C2C1